MAKRMTRGCDTADALAVGQRTNRHHVSVATYVALLRGINVGGHKKVSMDRLRELLGSLGHDGVATYLQSGNALFTSTATDVSELQSEIEERLATELGLDVKVLIRTCHELTAIMDANPFPAATREPSKLHVAFLSAAPHEDAVVRMKEARFGGDELVLGDRVAYLWYRDGAGRSKLTNDVLERRLGVTATSRNWNTVSKLLELACRED